MDGLINHENPDIRTIVTAILMDEENPNMKLSDWEGQNINVTSALEVLNKAVNDAVFNLRRILIGQKIEELMKEAMESQSKNIDLEMIKSYTQLKMRLFEKLNRVI